MQARSIPSSKRTFPLSFANIFMAEIETNLILQNNTKPRVWKRYIDDVFSLWDCNRDEVQHFIEEANTFHPTIKFTAEISENEITFLDTVVFEGERFIKEYILDSLQVEANFSIYPFYQVPPSGSKKRLYQRRSN